MINTAIVNVIVWVVMLVVFPVSASIAFGQERADQSNEELAREAKYTIGQARKIALRNFPGTIENEKLRKENGTLLYFFEIRDDYNIFVDVKIDATTGKILFDENENPIPDMVLKGSVNSLKKVGKGIRSAANMVVRLFPN